MKCRNQTNSINNSLKFRLLILHVVFQFAVGKWQEWPNTVNVFGWVFQRNSTVPQSKVQQICLWTMYMNIAVFMNECVFMNTYVYVCVLFCFVLFILTEPLLPFFFFLVRLPNCNYGICIHECMCACVCLKYTELQMKLWAVFSVIRLSSGFLIGSNNIQSYVYRCKDSRNVANVLNHNLLTSHRISIICQVLRSRVYFHCPLYPTFQYKKEKKKRNIIIISKQSTIR